MSLLHVENLDTYYGSSQALFGLSLDVEAGAVVSLLGRNGMGKTTTVHAIMGMVRRQSGGMTFDGRRIDRLASYQIAQLGLGLVPEGRQIFPNLTVTENLVVTASNRHHHVRPWTVEGIFDLFPALAERRRSMGNLISGGEQQMLAIGRALMTNPKLLMLDEATEGLAPLIRREIWACLERLQQEGQAILVIDKNVEDLTRLADRHYIIEKGRVVWSGDSAALRSAEEVRHRYLGV